MAEAFLGSAPRNDPGWGERRVRPLSTPRLRVWVDFDGTLVGPNVAILLVQEFVPDGRRVAEEVDQLLHRGEIGLREAWEREVALLPLDRMPEMTRFVRERVPLRTGAREFLDLARAYRLDVRILSGGLEFFIREVLDRERLDLPILSERLEILPTGGARVLYPYGHPTCRQCGICKAAFSIGHVEEERTILIADGSTDRYGAEVADIVFARRRLLDLCREAGIPHFPFEDFGPVTAQFRRWLVDREGFPPRRRRGLAASACPISRDVAGRDLAVPVRP